MSCGGQISIAPDAPSCVKFEKIRKTLTLQTALNTIMKKLGEQLGNYFSEHKQNGVDIPFLLGLWARSVATGDDAGTPERQRPEICCGSRFSPVAIVSLSLVLVGTWIPTRRSLSYTFAAITLLAEVMLEGILMRIIMVTPTPELCYFSLLQLL